MSEIRCIQILNGKFTCRKYGLERKGKNQKNKIKFADCIYYGMLTILNSHVEIYS